MANTALVKGINLAIIGALIPLKNKYPVLLTILGKSRHPSNDWDFFMTAGGVGMYLFTNKVDENEYAEIINQLKEADKQMVDAVDNLFTYLETRKSMNVDIRMATGFWVLWNIAGNPPTQEESKELAPAIGIYLQNVINNF